MAMTRKQKKGLFQGLMKMAKGITEGMQQAGSNKPAGGKKKPCGGCSGK